MVPGWSLDEPARCPLGVTQRPNEVAGTGRGRETCSLQGGAPRLGNFALKLVMIWIVIATVIIVRVQQAAAQSEYGGHGNDHSHVQCGHGGNEPACQHCPHGGLDDGWTGDLILCDSECQRQCGASPAASLHSRRRQQWNECRLDCIREYAHYPDTCDTLAPRQRRPRASMSDESGPGSFCISVANGPPNRNNGDGVANDAWIRHHPLKVPAGQASRCVTMFCLSADDDAVSGNCRCHQDRGCPIHREEPAEVPCGYDDDGKCFCARGFDFRDDGDDGCGFGEAFLGFLIAGIFIVAPTILCNFVVFPKPRDGRAGFTICIMNFFITMAIMGTYAHFYDFTGCNPVLFTFPFVAFVVGVTIHECRQGYEEGPTIQPEPPVTVNTIL